MTSCPTNTIICGDCIQTMQTFPSESVGLIVTSPPYNIRNSSSPTMRTRSSVTFWGQSPLMDGYENHNDNMPHDKYVKWQRAALTEMMRILKPNGAIYYNHKRRSQNLLEQDRKDILDGFPVRQTIIWNRKGGVNFNRRFFLPTYEDIYLIAKPDFKLKPKKCSVGAVWDISIEQNNPHPAPFPVAIPKRCIDCSEFDGPVLDPFIGSGSTAIAAIDLGVPWIGIDNSQTYTDAAMGRIKTHMLQIRNKTPQASLSLL